MKATITWDTNWQKLNPKNGSCFVCKGKQHDIASDAIDTCETYCQGRRVAWRLKRKTKGWWWAATTSAGGRRKESRNFLVSTMKVNRWGRHENVESRGWGFVNFIHHTKFAHFYFIFCADHYGSKTVKLVNCDLRVGYCWYDAGDHPRPGLVRAEKTL